jgi:hypothetical protein
MGDTPYAAGQFTSFELPAYAEQAVDTPGDRALKRPARKHPPGAFRSLEIDA